MLGDVLALSATALWAGSFILARGLRDDVPPISLNFWRWVVATVAIAPFALPCLLRKRHLVRRHAGHVAVTGLLGVSCYNTLVYVAGHTTAALNLSLLGICSPIFIVVLARLFAGEAITLRRAVGILVAASGVVVLVVGSPTRLTGVRVAPGDLWMLAATVLFAGYSLLVRRRPTEIDLPAFTLATFAFGVTALLPAYLAELIVVGPFRIDARIAGALVYVGLGASVAAFFAWNRAIDLVGAARPALLYYLVPVLTGLGGWAFLGESLHPGQVMSMALVVGGTIIGTKGSPSGRASSGDP